MPTPRLVPLPPTRGGDVPVARTPFWIGTAADAGLRLFLPGIADRHVSILEREDGFWVSPARPGSGTAVNGVPAAAPLRLRSGDVLQFAPGVVYRFDSGEPVRVAPAPPPQQPPAVLRPPPEPPRRRGGGLHARRTHRAKLLWWAAAGAAAALLVLAVVLALRTLRREAPTRAPLSEGDAAYLDSLMLVSSEKVERGTVLLENGAREAALREFAGAVNLLETSRLGRNPYVQPRIGNLEAAIAAVYSAQKITVPAPYRAVPSARRAAAPLPRGGLTVEQFLAALEEVQREFEARYGRRITVTGLDHAEHLSLYGAGGARDLRVRDLSREQISFAIDRFKRRGVRVKDFSVDSVLQAQIESARRAGHFDRMGTGLHMHVDRFANRYDRWTVE
jgi:hypothetical protein